MRPSSVLCIIVVCCGVFYKTIQGTSIMPPTKEQEHALVCYITCVKGDMCPPDCQQYRHLSPWGKRSVHRFGLPPLRPNYKRAFDQSSEFQGLSFDDYGWFMKLLGRIERRK